MHLTGNAFGGGEVTFDSVPLDTFDSVPFTDGSADVDGGDVDGGGVLSFRDCGGGVVVKFASAPHLACSTCQTSVSQERMRFDCLRGLWRAMRPVTVPNGR